MSTDPTAQAAEPSGRPREASGQPSEEELRAAYEAELSRITSADMMLQAAVSLLNIGGRRLGVMGPASGPGGSAGPGAGPDEPTPAGRDLEQVRDAIDGVRALLEILERRMPAELAPLRDALSQLQMAYAREVRPGAGDGASAPGTATAGAPGKPPQEASAERDEAAERPAGEPAPSEGERPGPAEASGRLWVPGR